MPKKFYWLKLEHKFFNQKTIKALREMERGSTYIIVYLKMLTYSLENNNKIYFDHVKDSFVEEIAMSIDEDSKDVEATLKFLEKVNLIQYVSDDELEFLQLEELTGKEGESAARMRKSRQRAKEDEQCDKNVTLEKEIEKDKDKKEIDKEKENLSRIVGIYEENFGVIYPASRNWFIEISEKIDYDLFEEAVKICIDKNNMTTGYLKGIIKKWLKDKIYSLKDYKLKERERQNRKSKLKSAPSSEDMEIDEKLIAEIKAMEEKMEA